MTPTTVMLVAAEASGDDRGADLMRAFRRRLGSEVRFVGVGGSRMAAQGLESPFDISELSVLGLVEGLMAYPKVVRRADETAALAARERPDIAVLIDSWGFTLRVAQRLRRQDPALPLVKYVGPQVWATRPGRAEVLARTVDHLLSIHKFDAPYFEAAGLPTTFVGNSTLSLDLAKSDDSVAAGAKGPVLAVLPGSRPSEIARILPAFEDAVRRLKLRRPDLTVLIPAAPTVAALVKTRVARWPVAAQVLEGEAAKLGAMKAATVALACSGTVTTELALAGCPMVVGYRLGRTTHAILKHLIRTPYITLLNIAAQDFVAPEFIQDDCNGPDLSAALEARLEDPQLRQDQVARQFAALDLMGRGGPDPSEAAAEAVLRILEARRAD